MFLIINRRSTQNISNGVERCAGRQDVEIKLDEFRRAGWLQVDGTDQDITVDYVCRVVRFVHYDSERGQSRTLLDTCQVWVDYVQEAIACCFCILFEYEVTGGTCNVLLDRDKQSTNIDAVKSGCSALKRLLTPHTDTLLWELCNWVNLTFIQRVTLGLIESGLDADRSWNSATI